MFRAKRSDVIAVGPVFNGASTDTSRRVMLVKNRDQDGETREYMIITRRRGADNPDTARPRKQVARVPAEDFTHAVRMFCDKILEQAWRDDLSHDSERS